MKTSKNNTPEILSPKRDIVNTLETFFSSKVLRMQSKWFFGEYIARLLEQKGGKKLGWHKKRLSEETGLSYSYISWVISGEASDKPNPPTISVDNLMLLAKALNIHPMKLITAYFGNDPDTDQSIEFLEIMDPKITNIIIEFVNQLPPEMITKIVQEAIKRQEQKRGVG